MMFDGNALASFALFKSLISTDLYLTIYQARSLYPLFSKHNLGVGGLALQLLC